MHAPERIKDFATTRLGVIMSPKDGEPHEAWGVMNPAGIRSPDGTMHLFPRLIAEGNYSRIGHARVRFNGEMPVGVERLGVALEPRESYERSAGGGGVEDPRVVYVSLLKRYVMTYTAFVPYEPRVATAISEDLQSWQRLGVLHFEEIEDGPELNACGNKDAALFPDVISDQRAFRRSESCTGQRPVFTSAVITPAQRRRGLRAARKPRKTFGSPTFRSIAWLPMLQR